MPAQAFDLQGHRGARGLAPENTLQALRAGARDRRDHARTRSRDDQGRRAGGQPRPAASTRITRAGRTERFSTRKARRSASLTLAEVQRYDVGRLKPRIELRPEFSRAEGGGRRAHSGADRSVRSGEAHSAPAHVRFNIETKITPTRAPKRRTRRLSRPPSPSAVREAGLTSRASVQSFDWRTLEGDEAHRAGDRARRASPPKR